MSTADLYVALIHYPVMNKKQQPIGSALTTIDMHDIARASITFGVKGFFVVTPFEDQALIARQVIEHWTKGVGGKLNPFRKEALELIHVVETYEDATAWLEKKYGKQAVSIATSAKKAQKTIETGQLKQMLEKDIPHVLLFGTAWGLAEELIEGCDYILEPIFGAADYNHLSVRSAASIYLDRIINGR